MMQQKLLNRVQTTAIARGSWPRAASSLRVRENKGSSRPVMDMHKNQEGMFVDVFKKNPSLRGRALNALAFSSDEDAFKKLITPETSSAMMEQLRISHNQLIPTFKPLPKSMNDVQRERRLAIVVTEMNPPFKIVHVNSAWEDLCGWTHAECHGRTLSLLQGQETDMSSVTCLVSKVLTGEEGGVVLTNYTKNGRRFRNHLRVGPLDEGLFVGVLREIQDGA